MLNDYQAHRFIIEHNRVYSVRTQEMVTRVLTHSPTESSAEELTREVSYAFTLFGPDGITPSRVVVGSIFNDCINKLVDFIEFLELSPKSS